MNLPAFLSEYTILIIVLSLFAVIAGCILFLRQIFAAEKKFEEKEEKTLKASKDILLHAHEDAEKILSNASLTETRINQDTLAMQQKITDAARETVQQTIKELAARYQQNAASLDTSLQQQTETLFTKLEATAQQQMKDFMEVFTNQTLGTQNTLTQQTQYAFAKMEKDLESFKADQQDKIKEEVHEIVKKVSAEVLGRTITTTEHQALLLEALEKAKKENAIKI